MTVPRRRPRLVVPEVVQSSGMDCGPASLKALLEGFGVAVSYGRLREACQTEVDGTSIDTLEQVAGQLGLDATQVMVPADHLLLAEARLLPALVVVRLPSGATHFVVAWNRVGPWVQVMDPATGRRWPTRAAFLRDLFIHSFPVAASAWHEWAVSDEFLTPLTVHVGGEGYSHAAAAELVARAAGGDDWWPLAALDGATRMVGSLVRSGGLRRGREAAAVLATTFEQLLASGPGAATVVPSGFFSVVSGPPSADGPTLLLRGAVLVRCRGLLEASGSAPGPAEATLPAELAAVLSERPTRPLVELLRLLRQDGALAATALAGGLAMSAFLVMTEALLFRSLLDVNRFLGLAEDRVAAVVALAAMLVAGVALAVPVMATMFRFGRHLEVRLRMAFLAKIPRLGDRYFHSRLSSDMAERAHAVSLVRQIPSLAGQLWRTTAQIAATTAAIIWLDPPSAGVAVVVAVVVVALPLVSQRLLTERDLKVRTHVGALTRFFLDSLLGLTAVRCHSAERAVRREHEALLVEWARASRDLLRVAVGVEGLVALGGFAAAAWLLNDHLARSGETGMVLLLVYWVLSLPTLGQEMAATARMVPSLRNITLRLLEPLGAREDGGAATAAGPTPPVQAGPAEVVLDQVTVRAGGHTILDGVSLSIPAGSHVAVVGPSGAGKSTLVGLLLGWHQPTEGTISVDGRPLEGSQLEALRRHTAWVDPAVRLWNRPLLDNLTFGSEGRAAQPLATTLEQARLLGILERLPDGLQTPLGEGGGLLSGGEGQRVRFGRALNRADLRLVILDEPFRGLDRVQRRTLLEEARQRYAGVTLICVTHDLRETAGFDRVVVVEDGRVVEDGSTTALRATPGSRYRHLLDAEDDLYASLWLGAEWRRLNLAGGVLSEDDGGGG